MSSSDNKRLRNNESSGIWTLLTSRRAILFGHHHQLSVWICFVALISTITVATAVALKTIRYTPTGPTAERSIVLHSPTYAQFWSWFTATFSGVRIHPVFTVGAVVLLLAAVGSTYLNRGLLPTAGLVMGPIFGFFVNRAGTPVIVANPHESGLSYAPMSLIDAIVWGLESALILGIPIILTGFTVGSILRLVISPTQIHRLLVNK